MRCGNERERTIWQFVIIKSKWTSLFHASCYSIVYVAKPNRLKQPILNASVVLTPSWSQRLFNGDEELNRGMQIRVDLSFSVDPPKFLFKSKTTIASASKFKGKRTGECHCKFYASDSYNTVHFQWHSQWGPMSWWINIPTRAELIKTQAPNIN